jgi:iron-only hydrogenase group A
MLNVTINDCSVQVPEGTTILGAARRAGVRVPTLCHMDKLQAIGACRVCVVEVEGSAALAAACVAPCVEGMRVRTASPRVREARRTVVELLVSEHDGECLTCDRNSDCELRALASEVGVRDVRYQGQRADRHIDASTDGIVRDTGKCVKCRRCVAVCQSVQGVGALWPQERGFDTVIGPATGKSLSEVPCVQCGQCAAVCPVGAITEHDAVPAVWKALADPKLHVVVQTAPAIRAALGECFGLPPGTRVTGRMVSALRRLGFRAVFDTNFAADLTIIEEGHELLGRLRAALTKEHGTGHAPKPLPMFTSCSPGWIRFAEHFFPDLLPNLSTCKSPQQMLGAVAKTWYARRVNRRPEELFVVSVMPCTAKKSEAHRTEMGRENVPDVDAVLTTRELGRMIREAGIDFAGLPDESMDDPLGLSTGAADIFGATGGVMEAALRTAYKIVTGRDMPFPQLHVASIIGLDGTKEAEIPFVDVRPEWKFLEGVTARVAVVHGLGNARALCDRVRAGTAPYHFVEVMTCPGGCIGGGGQPRLTDDAMRLARTKALYLEDEGKVLRQSHENEQVMRLYKEFLGEPNGHLAHELLHTHYTDRTCQN